MDIWTLPGLDQTQFNAAAYYLSKKQRQQNKTANAISTAMRTRNEDPDKDHHVREFLDRVADVFARSKGRDKAGHVTATALVGEGANTPSVASPTNAPSPSGPSISLESDRTNTTASSSGTNPPVPGAEGGKKQLTIYIAKNQGAKPDDEKFATEFCTWLNKLQAPQLPEMPQLPAMEDEMWKRILSFCSSRIAHYITRIGKLKFDFDKISPQSQAENEFEDMSDIVRRCKDFMNDNKRNDSRKVSRHSDLSIHAFKCRQKGLSRPYEKAVEDPATDEQFRKLLKYIDLLGRLPSAWRSFVKYRREHLDFIFEHKFIHKFNDKQDRHEIKPGALYNTIKGWGGDLDADEILCDLQEMGKKKEGEDTMQCYFHCELQLLKRFTDTNSQDSQFCFPYFGCSKNSCWLCWQILSVHPKYTTKGSHNKIYPLCHFPFLYSKEDESGSIARGLKNAQDTMRNMIFEKAIDATAAWSVNDALDETSLGFGKSTQDNRQTQLLKETDTAASTLSETHQSSSDLPFDSRFHELVDVIKLPCDSRDAIIKPVELHLADTESFLYREPVGNIGDEPIFMKLQLSPDIRSWIKDRFIFKDFMHWVFFRVDNHLPGNPWCLEALGVSDDTDNFIWRGDVYIIKKEAIENPTNSRIDHRPKSIDSKACLEKWRRVLTKQWALGYPEYARSCRETATFKREQLENMQQGMKRLENIGRMNHELMGRYANLSDEHDQFLEHCITF